LFLFMVNRCRDHVFRAHISKWERTVSYVVVQSRTHSFLHHHNNKGKYLFTVHIRISNSGTVQRYSVGLRAGDRRFDSRQGLGIFLFNTASRPVLGPTHPPIQWVPWVLSLQLKRPGCESHQSPPSSAEMKNGCSCTSTPPTHLHGVVLS
jgi:hypothetical protein